MTKSNPRDEDRLKQLQREFMENHRDADWIECNKNTGRVNRAIYESPEYKADAELRKFFEAVARLEIGEMEP